MRSLRNAVCAVLLTLGASVATARIWEVPGDFDFIQDAIVVASDGDVISVWGPTWYQPPDPPYVYHENVDYLGKSLVVVNRSFIEEIPGYPPSWDHVVIDGSNQAGSVVTMTGDALSVPRVVLKGFTITGGGSQHGGGIKCQDVVAVIDKNHAQD